MKESEGDRLDGSQIPASAKLPDVMRLSFGKSIFRDLLLWVEREGSMPDSALT
jgi:hypothetical protein